MNSSKEIEEAREDIHRQMNVLESLQKLKEENQMLLAKLREIKRQYDELELDGVWEMSDDYIITPYTGWSMGDE